jgi:hypothetical protein
MMVKFSFGGEGKSTHLINSAPCYDICGSGCIGPPFLTLTLDGGEISAPPPI